MSSFEVDTLNATTRRLASSADRDRLPAPIDVRFKYLQPTTSDVVIDNTKKLFTRKNNNALLQVASVVVELLFQVSDFSKLILISSSEHLRVEDLNG